MFKFCSRVSFPCVHLNGTFAMSKTLKHQEQIFKKNGPAQNSQATSIRRGKKLFKRCKFSLAKNDDTSLTNSVWKK